MKICKKNNQYYGQYFEEALVAAINKEPFTNNTSFEFSEEELREFQQDALACAKYLKATTARYVGRAVNKENCDAYIDEESSEIKYVSAGTGTYFNTSISYLNKIGYTKYNEYLERFGIYQILVPFFGENIRGKISPVSIKESSLFQREHVAEYKELVKQEKICREQYVLDLYNYLHDNPDKLLKFVYDMITKEAANKKAPERLIIFNHETKNITKFSKKQLCHLLQQKNFRRTALGLVFNGFRVQVGWQNGTGLCNPTLRVFLTGGNT